MTRDDDISIIEVDDLDLTFEPRPWPFVEAYARDAEAHWQRLAAVNPLQFNERF